MPLLSLQFISTLSRSKVKGLRFSLPSAWKLALLSALTAASLPSFAWAGTAAAPLNDDLVWIDTASQENAINSLTGSPLSVISVNVPGGTGSSFPLQEDQGVQVGSRLYFFGGQTNGQGYTCTRNVFYYDMVADRWVSLPDMPRGLSHCAFAVDGATIWILGGYVEQDPLRSGSGKYYSTTQVLKYDTVTGTWSDGPPMPYPRGGGEAVIAGRTLHFIGGSDQNRKDPGYAPADCSPNGTPPQNSQNTGTYVSGYNHWTLDLDNPAAGWTVNPHDLLVPRNHIGGVYLNGKIWVVAGQQGNISTIYYYTRVDSYNPLSDTWTRENDLNPPPRSHCYSATIPVDGGIFVVGGLNDSSPSPANQASFFDPTAIDPNSDLPGVWHPLPILPDGRYFSLAGTFSSSFDPNTLVVAGRSNNATIGITLKAPSNVIETVQPQGTAVAWTSNSTNETGFYIERRRVGSRSEWERIGNVPAGSTSYTDTSAVSNVAYTYRVRAYVVWVNGQVAISRPSNDDAPVNLVAAYTPAAAGKSTASVGLSWNASSGAHAYYVYRSYTPGVFSSVPLQTIIGQSTTDSTVAANRPAYYVVTSCNVDSSNTPDPTTQSEYSAQVAVDLPADSPTHPSVTNGGGTTLAVGQPFNFSIDATGSPTDYSACGLPPGLTINSNGVISGAPTKAGTTVVALNATNAEGTGSANFTFKVGTPAPSINSTLEEAGSVGTPVTPYSISASNSPNSFSASGLPPGLTFSGTTISGTPTTAGAYFVKLSATNNTGTGTAWLTWIISPPSTVQIPVVVPPPAIIATAGQPFSYQIVATNDPSSYMAAGLPQGLSIDNSTGLITGTPTSNGTTYVTLTAQNAAGIGSATLTLLPPSSTPAPAIISSLAATATVGQAFSYQITASSNPTSFSASGLPGGLSLSSSGLISGTPTSSATLNVTLTATNGGGSGSATLVLTVNPATPSITSSLAASATVGQYFTYQITGSNKPTSFSATGLPSGLSLNSSTGLITGTPTAAGKASVSLSATNARGSGNAILILSVNLVSPAASSITSSLVANATVGLPFSYQITGSNTPTSFSATGLPSGLSLSSSTGLISGTPTSAGKASVALSATNGGGSGSAILVLTINPAAPSITSALAATATVGKPFSYQITGSNTPTSFSATGLPSGLSLSSSTGLISGTPTSAGKASVALSATNGGGSGSAILVLTINSAAPAITSALAATATVGKPFSYQITGSNTPTSFSATGLPSGLSLSSSTGLISGTPTAAATASVALSATNAGGSGSAILVLTINPAAPSITSALAATATVGKPFSYQITGSNTPTSFSASGLPSGLSLSSSTGLISGTPASAATASVALSATNAGGSGSAILVLTINSAAPSITSALAATATVGKPFSYQITGSNTPTSFSATGLPTGLSLSSSNGLISGTPASAATASVALSATNAGGSGRAILVLTINPAAPSITSSLAATATVGKLFSYQITGSNTPTSFSATGLPSGLSLSSSTGLISGTPTSAATASVALSATNAGGSGSAILVLTINSAAPSITSALAATATVGKPFSYQITGSNTPTSFSATGLPSGLSLSSSSGLISGTPASAVTASVALSATNAGGSGSAILVLTINSAAPSITSALAATATVGKPFSYQITGSNTPTSFSATGLPTGLSLSSSNGLISGTPASAATASVALSATNAGGSGRAILVLTINPAAPSITSSLAATATVGKLFSYQITGSNTPTSFSATGLPSGLSLSSSSGLISGTPTSASTANIALSATNAGGSGSATLVLTINPAVPAITSALAATATVGQPFNYQITGSNTPTSFSASGLPSGLSVSSSTGLISGTPTSAATASVALSATNAGGSGSAILVLTINQGANQKPPASAPSGLVAAAWDSSVDLHWNAVAGATGYNVSRATNNGGAYTLIASNVSSPFTNRNLTDGTTYSYVVQASNTFGAGPACSPVSATPLANLGLDQWTSQDIGTVAFAGSSSYTGGTYTLKGSGADIWNESDNFQFVYQTMTGDGCIIAQVPSEQNTSIYAKAGVMMRDTLDANSAEATMLVNIFQAGFQYRLTAGANTNQVLAMNTNHWIKLSRTGSIFTGYTSPDGVSWTQVGSPQTIAMSPTICVGMAVCAHDNTKLNTSTFASVAIVPTATWSSEDLGNPPPLAGFTSYTGSVQGVLTVTASGADIWNTSDAFRFTYQSLAGDGTMTVRVDAVQNIDPWSKAGIMIRESTAANASYAAIYVTPGEGVSFQWRNGTGANANFTDTSMLYAPYWLRLTRAGNLFSSYTSTDGVHWVPNSTALIPMATNVYIGLALTSHDANNSATSIFDSISIP